MAVPRRDPHPEYFLLLRGMPAVKFAGIFLGKTLREDFQVSKNSFLSGARELRAVLQAKKQVKELQPDEQPLLAA